MEFPYGKAPLAILIIALMAGAALLAASIQSKTQPRPDLIFATFTKEHAGAYKDAIAQFEKDNHVTIQIQVVDQYAIKGRLQAALQAGAEVPDLVELLDDTMGFFTKGPLPDVGFTDLTERIKTTVLDGKPLYDNLVTSRFSKWSSRGHIFALIHDVHPTMLAYRKDLVEQLGIDVTKLTTWDEFMKVGQQVSRDTNGDGVIEHYMMDLPVSEPWGLRTLMLQQGISMFDAESNTTFDKPGAADILCWYVRATQGKTKISFAAGWGQTLARAMTEGVCLFYICPDWRTKQFELDVPAVKGKLSLMPLPAWEPGGRRTSTWGATGLAIPKATKNFDLAWKFATYLYYSPKDLGKRFAVLNIIPPYKPAWNEPQINAPRAFWSDLRIGRLYADLAPQVPDEPSNAYMLLGQAKLLEAYSDTVLYYNEHGDEGLHKFAEDELKRCADQVRAVIARNVFLTRDKQVVSAVSPAGTTGGTGVNTAAAAAEVK